ncbi:hypothetical protein LA080_004971 [Diaporthe eres]|nr:hypothetical protein LA080_004971 [Diaporthe eres]
MDVNISRDDYFSSMQPRHIPGNDHPTSNKTQTPKHLSSEREIKFMKRLRELERVIEELKGQVTRETAPSQQMPQRPGHQNVPLQGNPVSDNSVECTPIDRAWPGQKCHRCANMGPDCSASVTKKAGVNRTARAKERVWTALLNYATQNETLSIPSQLEANLAETFPVWPTQDAPYNDNGTGDQPDSKQDGIPKAIERIWHIEMPGILVDGGGGGGTPLNDFSCLYQLTCTRSLESQ